MRMLASCLPYTTAAGLIGGVTGFILQEPLSVVKITLTKLVEYHELAPRDQQSYSSSASDHSILSFPIGILVGIAMAINWYSSSKPIKAGSVAIPFCVIYVLNCCTHLQISYLILLLGVIGGIPIVVYFSIIKPHLKTTTRAFLLIVISGFISCTGSLIGHVLVSIMDPLDNSVGAVLGGGLTCVLYIVTVSSVTIPRVDDNWIKSTWVLRENIRSLNEVNQTITKTVDRLRPVQVEVT